MLFPSKGVVERRRQRETENPGRARGALGRLSALVELEMGDEL